MFPLTNAAVILSLTALLATGCVTQTLASATTRPAVVVELFTSEGCSSCPPADELLADLSKPGAIDGIQIVPLSMHVDYWNDLGWADPFSSPQFSDRQKWYARLLNSDEVYTPQMIVNGTDQFVGSDHRKADDAITRAAIGSTGDINIQQTRDPQNKDTVVCNISIDGLRLSAPANVMLAVTEDNLSTEVPRGENTGRTLRHTGVVRSLIQIGACGPNNSAQFAVAASIHLLATWKMDDLHFVVFVQSPQSGAIYAAATRSVDHNMRSR